MKNIIIILACALLSVHASAQAVNIHNDNGIVYCNSVISSIKTDDSTKKLSITTFNDNQIDHAVIYFAIRDSAFSVITSGNYDLCGSDYATWTNVSYLYNFVANKINSDPQYPFNIIIIY